MDDPLSQTNCAASSTLSTRTVMVTSTSERCFGTHPGSASRRTGGWQNSQTRDLQSKDYAIVLQFLLDVVTHVNQHKNLTCTLLNCQYRVTHQVVTNLPLTSKQSSLFAWPGLAWPGQNGTFVLKSTGGSSQPDVSPCTKVESAKSIDDCPYQDRGGFISAWEVKEFMAKLFPGKHMFVILHF